MKIEKKRETIIKDDYIYTRIEYTDRTWKWELPTLNRIPLFKLELEYQKLIKEHNAYLKNLNTLN